MESGDAVGPCKVRHIFHPEMMVIRFKCSRFIGAQYQAQSKMSQSLTQNFESVLGMDLQYGASNQLQWLDRRPTQPTDGIETP